MNLYIYQWSERRHPEKNSMKSYQHYAAAENVTGCTTYTGTPKVHAKLRNCTNIKFSRFNFPCTQFQFINVDGKKKSTIQLNSSRSWRHINRRTKKICMRNISVYFICEHCFGSKNASFPFPHLQYVILHSDSTNIRL